jgi:hypothetical protein
VGTSARWVRIVEGVGRVATDESEMLDRSDVAVKTRPEAHKGGKE